MCYTARESLLAFVIIAGVALLIWKRNQNYDRVLANFLFVVSLIQLVEFGFHMNLISSSTGGKLTHLILWLQPLILCLATALYLSNMQTFNTLHGIAWMMAFIYLALFVRACIVIGIPTANGNGDNEFSISHGCSGHLEWTRNHQMIIHSEFDQSAYLYGLLGPMLLLLFVEKKESNYGNSESNPGGLILFILAGVLSLFWVRKEAPGLEFSSLWCFSAFLVAVTAYVSNSPFFKATMDATMDGHVMSIGGKPIE